MTASVLGAGIARLVGAPAYGRQDVGYAPDGPIDRFSMHAGNALLGQALDAPALEIVHARGVEFGDACWFVLTGARRLARRDGRDVPHATVVPAERGDVLTLAAPEAGWRTYVCTAPRDHVRSTRAGASLPSYESLCTWRDPQGRIRAMDGPEHAGLRDDRAFLEQPWVTGDMSDGGILLAARGDAPLAYDGPEMISSPVADGTVQLTPQGPIILLRERQTIGGYPRVFVVADVDVDALGQYAPRRVLRFTRISCGDAIDAARERERVLRSLATA